MKKYRIEIVTMDPFVSVEGPDGSSHPQTYSKIQYMNDLDVAVAWAKEYIGRLRGVKYVRTEIKEFSFVRDIPVDF